MASTTIVPFSSLPTCALECGRLYDANGACVPPAVGSGPLSQYAACFCNNQFMTTWATATTGVCGTACATETSNLGSIRAWFTSFCEAEAGLTYAELGAGTATSTATPTSTGQSSSKGNTWLNNHWRWVVFIVVVVVAIIGIWVGACIWHRRYVRRKDRQYALQQMRNSAAPGAGAPGAATTAQRNSQMSFHQAHRNHDSIIMAASNATPGTGTPTGQTQAPTTAQAPAGAVPGTAVTTYDASAEKKAEKRKSNVLFGRRH